MPVLMPAVNGGLARHRRADREPYGRATYPPGSSRRVIMPGASGGFWHRFIGLDGLELRAHSAAAADHWPRIWAVCAPAWPVCVRLVHSPGFIIPNMCSIMAMARSDPD